MGLSGSQYRQIQNTFQAALSKEDLREIVRYEFDVQLEEIVADGNLRDIVFNVVKWVEQRDRVDDLIRAACSHNSTNDGLQRLMQDSRVWFAVDQASTNKKQTGTPEQTRPAGNVQEPEGEPQNRGYIPTQREGPNSRRLRVFLCHASDDKPRVHSIYSLLVAQGFDPWLDEIELLPGQKWHEEILRAVRSSDVILVCLSRNSITKSGYIQTEITQALDEADKQPEGAIFLIPAKLEPCSVPERLNQWHWVELHTALGKDRLLATLRKRAEDLDLYIAPSPAHSRAITPEWSGSSSSVLQAIIGLALGGITTILASNTFGWQATALVSTILVTIGIGVWRVTRLEYYRIFVASVVFGCVAAILMIFGMAYLKGDRISLPMSSIWEHISRTIEA